MPLNLPIDMTNAQKNMPNVLYRGDQAKRICKLSNRSLMVDQYQQLGLFTNLICSGNPLAVNRSGIRATVSQHIKGWSQSHYLSFSTDRKIAEIFAQGFSGKSITPTYGNKWDSVIFEFNTSKVSWKIRGIGVFCGTKKVQEPTYLNGLTTVLLIDCVTLLRSIVASGGIQFQPELDLAQQYKEWLLIPADTMPPGHQYSHIGYSAVLHQDLVIGNHFDFI